MAALAGTALAAESVNLRALTWTATGEEWEALAHQPATCLAPAWNMEQLRTGRALFNAPQLLGGQAARADISCASCHSNGRVNRHFFLDGVSGEPGTADVSSSFFALARSNHRFDPKPIPDLALPGKISRDPVSGGLETFLRGLIVEEFDGREPGRDVLAALAAYVRAIGPCVGRDEETRGLPDQVGLVRDAVSGAASMARRDDHAASVMLVSAARTQLGLIHERYAGARLTGKRRLLIAASRELQAIAEAGAPDPEDLTVWLARFDGELVPRLRAAEARSLYDPGQLRTYLAGDR